MEELVYRQRPTRMYDLKKHNGRHREIVRLHCAGWGNKDIARRLGVTEQTVSICLNGSLAQQQIQVLQGKADAGIIDVLEFYKQGASDVAEKQEEMIYDDTIPASVRAKLMQDWLDRAGYGAVKKVAVNHGVFTQSDLDEIKKRAQKNKSINAHYTVVDTKTEEQDG